MPGATDLPSNDIKRLCKELNAATVTQSVIVRLANAMLADSKHSEQISKLWTGALHAATRDRVLPLMYVANDVLAKANHARYNANSGSAGAKPRVTPAVWVATLDGCLDDAMDVVAYRTPEHVPSVKKILQLQSGPQCALSPERGAQLSARLDRPDPSRASLVHPPSFSPTPWARIVIMKQRYGLQQVMGPGRSSSSSASSSSAASSSSSSGDVPEDAFKADHAVVQPPPEADYVARAGAASTEQLLEDAVFRLRASATMGSKVEAMPAAVLAPGMPLADVGEHELGWLCEQLDKHVRTAQDLNRVAQEARGMRVQLVSRLKQEVPVLEDKARRAGERAGRIEAVLRRLGRARAMAAEKRAAGHKAVVVAAPSEGTSRSRGDGRQGGSGASGAPSHLSVPSTAAATSASSSSSSSSSSTSQGGAGSSTPLVSASPRAAKSIPVRQVSRESTLSSIGSKRPGRAGGIASLLDAGDDDEVLGLATPKSQGGSAGGGDSGPAAKRARVEKSESSDEDEEEDREGMVWNPIVREWYPEHLFDGSEDWRD